MRELQTYSLRRRMPMNHFIRPGSDQFGAYFGTYVAQLDGDDRDVLHILRETGLAVLAGLKAISDEQAEHRYAPGKWSVKELVGHLIDTERLFAFRALWFARGEPAEQPGMNENLWGRTSNAHDRPLPDLWREQHVCRTDHVYLFRSLDRAALDRRGTANGSVMTARAIPWLIAGHERHHLNVLKKKYGVG